MKKLLWAGRISFYLICWLLVSSSCVNKLEETREITPGKTPIQFSYTMQKYRTRVTENTFEKGDKVGLSAYFHEGKNKGVEYISNIILHCTDGKEMIPETPVFYPEKSNPIDIFAYYPYQEKVDKEKRQLTISVPNIQGKTLGNKNFLVARTENVKSSDNNVKLKFKHGLSKINIKIKLEQKNIAEKLSGKRSNIIISNVATKGNYNIDNGSYTDLEMVQDVATDVVMKNDNGLVTGPVLYLIPQKLTENNKIFLEWEGRTYCCDLPITELKAGYQQDLIISSLIEETKLMTGTLGEIEEWETTEEKNTNNQADLKEFHIRTYSFTESYVYRIYREGVAVAEFCLEWLNNENSLKNAGLVNVGVVYPVHENKTDITKGILLYSQNVDKKICGGKVAWNKENNSYTLEKGDKGNIMEFYINDKNEIVFDKKEAVKIEILARQVIDIREGVIVKYPIVKIGSQYWMKENLRATAFRDNTPIIKKSVIDGEGYMKTENDDILYSGHVFNHQDMVPKGWKIPSQKNWETLMKFTHNNICPLVKGNYYKKFENQYSGASLLNLSPTGIWEHSKVNELNSKAVFWCMDNENTDTNAKCFVIDFNKDGKVFSSEKNFIDNQNLQKGAAIRCIEE